MTRSVLMATLEQIRSKHPQGLLLPEDVVAAAKPPKSPLHSHFEWDNSAAAHQWRLSQARQLIRIRILSTDGLGRHPAYVSLKSDRYETGGYRETTEVINTKGLRESLLEEALEDLQAWERRYRSLTEMQPVVAAADKVRQRLGGGKRRKRA